MTLISMKTKILSCLDNLIYSNDNEKEWIELDDEIKFKIIHNLCNELKKSTGLNKQDNLIQNHLSIPLKHLRPIKFIKLCGIDKHTHNEFKQNILDMNCKFRAEYNKNNNYYCFANMPNDKYCEILNNYNFQVYKFLSNNTINCKSLYFGLLGQNDKKIIQPNITELKITQIDCNEKYLNIKFNNNVIIKLELYITSEKISKNINALYKISLLNIF